MPLVAGVDSSTQSTKVELRDVDTGELVARASSPHPATTPPVSEQDPSAWWSAFEAAWDDVGPAARTADVVAIAVAAQQHGAVVLDADRTVVRPALLWNDTRSSADAGWLRGQVDGGDASWASAVGSVPVGAFTVAKLSWLHRNDPGAWERLAHVVLPHDWLTARLTSADLQRAAGELVTDRGDASGTGYWSPAAGEYRFDLLGVVDRDRDWTTVVPRVAGPLEAVGSYGGAVVAPGTGDNMGAALGLALAPGDAVVSIGTSGTVFARSEHATADASGAVAGFADATGGFLPLVCTLNGAKVLDAVRRLLGVDVEEFDRLALHADAAGVTLLPYFDGERVPDRPGATGRIAGLRSDVSREQLARAAVDGVVCGLLDGLDELRRHTDVDGKVVLTGGATRSRAVRAVFAAMCDLPVTTGVTDEAVSTGACVQAAAVLAQVPPDAVAQRWGLGDRAEVEAFEIDTEAVRSVRRAYDELKAESAAGSGIAG